MACHGRSEVGLEGQAGAGRECCAVHLAIPAESCLYRREFNQIIV